MHTNAPVRMLVCCPVSFWTPEAGRDVDRAGSNAIDRHTIFLDLTVTICLYELVYYSSCPQCLAPPSPLNKVSIRDLLKEEAFARTTTDKSRGKRA